MVTIRMMYNKPNGKSPWDANIVVVRVPRFAYWWKQKKTTLPIMTIMSTNACVPSRRTLSALVTATILSTLLITTNPGVADAPGVTLPPLVVSVVKTPVVKAKAPMVRPRDEALCLAQALFFESGNQMVEGVEAVAAVIFNRASTRRKKVCDVIWEQRMVTMRNGTQRLIGQFTYTADGKPEYMPPSIKKRWIAIARDLMANRDILISRFGPIDHYHRVDVYPKWKDSPQLMPVATIGDHIFYQRVLRAKHSITFGAYQAY